MAKPSPGKSKPRYSRRKLLAGAAVVAGAGLVLSLVDEDEEDVQLGTRPGTLEPNAYLQITPAGEIVLQVDKVEMGQGVMAGFVTMLAEELGVRPEQITPRHAPVHAYFQDPSQITGESRSIRSRWEKIRRTGATAREMLVRAASDHWRANRSEIRVTGNATLANQLTGAELGYGELAAAAARKARPFRVGLKTPAEFEWIGTDVPRPDLPDKIRGRAVYGSDTALPGLRTAVVRRAPRIGDRVLRFDAEAALAMPGVHDAVEIHSGLAVVGDTFWHARQAAQRIEVDWAPGPLAGFDIRGLRDQHVAALETGRIIGVRDDGDTEPAFESASSALNAEFFLPYLAHATMEPMNATVRLTDARCDIWAPTQAPDFARQVACDMTGLSRSQVHVHTTFIGGGFGRRAMNDFIAEAVAIAMRTDGPIKLIWSRDDDMRHGYFRSATTHRLSAALNDLGRITAWRHRLVAPPLTQHILPPALATLSPEWMPKAWIAGAAGFANRIQSAFLGPIQAWDGAKTLPYAIDNVCVEVAEWDPGVPVSIWRSVGNSYNAFVVEAFIDELAHAAGTDPVEFRRQHLAVRPQHLAVLDRVATEAGWGRAGPGRHQGLAIHECFGSVVGQIAEVSIGEDAAIHVHRVCCAVDCGMAVNPDVVRAQLEGGIVFGLTAALYGSIDIRDGRVQQSNFHNYRMLTLADAPDIDVHIIESDADPGGIGETGTPPIAPAVANAVFAATRRRLRELPLRLEGGA